MDCKDGDGKILWDGDECDIKGMGYKIGTQDDTRIQHFEVRMLVGSL